MQSHDRATDLRNRREIACEILQYLSNHPTAKDTIEGIAGWWLERQRIECTVDEVAESLRLLVNSGLILERQGGAARHYYQVNLAKRAEIARFLEKDDTGSGRNTSWSAKPAAKSGRRTHDTGRNVEDEI